MVNHSAADMAALPVCIAVYTIIILFRSYLPYLMRHPSPRIQRFRRFGIRVGQRISGLWKRAKQWMKGLLTRGQGPLIQIPPSSSGLGFGTWVNCLLSLAYGWALLTSFRTTIQAISYAGRPIDCSVATPNPPKYDLTPEVLGPFYKLLGLVQITPLEIYTNASSDGQIDSSQKPCATFFAANATSPEFNNIFNTALVPLFNFCGTDLWETYSGAGVLNPNFATIIGAPIGAFGMFKGGIKKLFPRHVRNMEWQMLDVAGSRKRFLTYKLWTRHYTHIDPTREFEANYFRNVKIRRADDAPPLEANAAPEYEWKWGGRRKLPGFTKRPHGEYMHGTSDDLMHLGPNETVVTNETVRQFNAMLIRNGISSLVRSAVAICITVTPILVVRQLQDRQYVVDDASYLAMQIWIGAALSYSVACVFGGWFSFFIRSSKSGDDEAEILVTYNQTGGESYRMGTYYSQGAARYQNGFHQWPFQCAAFVQGITSVLLSAVAALTLVSLINSIIWIITHTEWHRGDQVCLWLPSVVVVFYRFLFVLPFSRTVDDRPYDKTRLGRIRRVFAVPYYNWLARLPQLSGQSILTDVVYKALKLHDDPVKNHLGTHFLAPMRLSWLSGPKAVVKTTLHGGYYEHFPTKMLLEGVRGALHVTFHRKCLMDGSLLEILAHTVATTVDPGATDEDSELKTRKRPNNLSIIDPNATYLVMFSRGNGQGFDNLRAIRIPGEPWTSEHAACGALYIGLGGIQAAPNATDDSADTSKFTDPVDNVCITVRLRKNYPQVNHLCAPCCAEDQQGDFGDCVQKRNADDLRPCYAILYRQHPSKPYALLSGRRSGEVVARRLPGLLDFSTSELVCIQRIADIYDQAGWLVDHKDALLPADKRKLRRRQNREDDGIRMRNRARNRGGGDIRALEAGDINAGNIDTDDSDDSDDSDDADDADAANRADAATHANGAGANVYRINREALRHSPVHVHHIDLNHKRKRVLTINVFKGGHHLDSETMTAENWEPPKPDPPAEPAPPEPTEPPAQPPPQLDAFAEILGGLIRFLSATTTLPPPTVPLRRFQAAAESLRTIARSVAADPSTELPVLLAGRRVFWNRIQLALNDTHIPREPLIGPPRITEVGNVGVPEVPAQPLALNGALIRRQPWIVLPWNARADGARAAEDPAQPPALNDTQNPIEPPRNAGVDNAPVPEPEPVPEPDPERATQPWKGDYITLIELVPHSSPLREIIQRIFRQLYRWPQAMLRYRLTRKRMKM